MAEVISQAGTNSNALSGIIGMSKNFAQLNRVIFRDVNKYQYDHPILHHFRKEDISRFLAHPDKNEKELRAAMRYIYGASPHFRRLIQYFVGLSDLSYVVEPYQIDPKKASARIINNNYRRVLNCLSDMSIRTQFPKILTVCLREDVFYGTFIISADDITIQQLPSDYCCITTVEGKVPNVTFDFSYFNAPRRELLEYYPPEFKLKYELYQNDRRHRRWQELDSPNSFAVKCNTDILNYALPPFTGLLPEIFDLEEYRNMKKAKTALNNYAMLAMQIPMDDEGNWLLDEDKA